MAAGLVGLALLLIALQPVFAQQAGKRLAFVVGLGDYGQTQHPTALGDAGLIAQTLKGNGFEVTEAANLNQSEFRDLFRAFSDKAMEAGPDAVVMVYVSGLALQDDGDNILIPVDARLRQRNDLATEGLRIADFLRGVSGLPAQARFVFVDAAYQHPVLQLVADGGRGLSLADRAEGTLIGFNQSPGRAAPLPTTNYGPFAMALAEVLVEPGLPVEGMMERLRLRVHDLTQGTVTPWLLSGITPGFVLNPGAPATAAVAPEAALLRERPLAQLTPEQGYARAVEIDTIAAYEDFIRAFPNHALTKRARATVAARREAAYWQRSRRANTERAYWTYLKRYPKGAHAAEAEDRLLRLSAPVAPPPSFEEVVYDDLPPPPPEELVIYEEVVVAEEWDTLPPPWAGPVGFLPPPPVALIELPPPPPPRVEERGLPLVAITAGVVGVTAAAILANRAWRRPPRVRETTFVPPPRPPREPGFGRRPVALPPGVDSRGITAPRVTNRPPLVRPNLPPPGGPGSIPGVLNPGRPGAIPQPVPPGTRPDVNAVQQPPQQRPTTLPPPNLRPGPDGRPVPPGLRPGFPPGTGGPGQPPAVATPPGTGGPAQRPGIGSTPPGTGGPQQRPGLVPQQQPGTGGPAQRPGIGATPPGTGGVGPRPIGPNPPNTPGITPPRPPGSGDSRLVQPDRRPTVNPGVNPGVRQPQPQFRPPPPQGRPMPQNQQPGIIQSRPMPPQGRQVAPPMGRPPEPQVRQAPQARPAPPMMRPAPPPQAQPQMRQAPPPMARPTPPAPPPAVRAAPPPPMARPAAPPPVARPAAPPPAGGCTPAMRAARQC